MSKPFALPVITLELFKGAKLVERVKSGKFHRMHPFDAIKESRNLLSLLSFANDYAFMFL